MGKTTFGLAGREWPTVKWWNRSNMRTLYFTLWAAMLTSATNGYDGSLMNGLESIQPWIEGMFLMAANNKIGLLEVLEILNIVTNTRQNSTPPAALPSV